ncbi:unnamed protein product [Effrenium voratum]|nr:unnamed protein product [Effrenium voratum]
MQARELGEELRPDVPMKFISALRRARPSLPFGHFEPRRPPYPGTSAGSYLAISLLLSRATRAVRPLQAGAVRSHSKTGSGSLNPVLAGAISQMSFSLPTGAVLPLVPLLVTQHFDLSANLWGVFCAVEGVAKIFCAVPVAYYLNKWGRKPLLVSSLCGYSFVPQRCACLGVSARASRWGPVAKQKADFKTWIPGHIPARLLHQRSSASSCKTIDWCRHLCTEFRASTLPLRHFR